MRVLVIGASGQLGRELVSVLRGEVIGTYHSSEGLNGYKLDLTDFASVEDFIMKKGPDVVINAAAMTDVDACERDKEKALKINAEAVRHIARASRVVEAYLVHVSTDYVFDGEKGLYREEDSPNPVNYYGLSKLLGEAFALSYDDALVVRTSGVFRHKDFPIYAYKTLKQGGEVHAFKGFYSPISARKLAETISELVELRKSGIIHVAGERVSRFDLALRIKEMFKLPGSVREVERVEGWVARRPFDSSLDVSRARKLLSTDFYSLEENLKYMVV
ncbi:MAG: SDR family oxidoreductase [Thermoprotei archaeon]